MSNNHKNNADTQPRRDSYADSGAVDFDMTPEAIERRLKTVGQLNRLAQYLSKGIVLGPVNANVSTSHPKE